MRVLIACEYSGRVRDAFIAQGADALSCDLLPTEAPGPHYQGDVRDLLDYPWDLMIAHPPCTHLAVSGAKHFAGKRLTGAQHAAASFFLMLVKANIPAIAIENPVSIMSSLYRKPDQIIQPWHFGEKATKTTCLWLKNLPLLRPTHIVDKGQRIYYPSGKSLPDWYANLSPKDRAKQRSATFSGIAKAMAQQWSTDTSSASNAAPEHPIDPSLPKS